MASAAVRRPPSLRESSPPRVRIFPTLVYRCTGVDFRLLSGLMPHEDPRGGRTDTASPEFTSIRRHPARTSNRPLSEVATFGAERSSTSGTRCPLPPRGSLSGSLDSRESGQHRGPPTSGDLRGSPATATLGGSHHRTPGVRVPSLVRVPAPRLEFGCFRIAYCGLRCLDGRIVGIGTRASQGWTIRGRV